MFQNVEVFYYDGGTDSDGRTAFANGNSTLSTENRLEILSTYVKELQRLYGVDPTRSPISDDEVRQALAGLKPRPLPAVRRELDLTTARAFAAPRGYRRAYACAFEPEGGWGEDWDGARVVETDGAPFGRSAAQLRAGTGETTTMRGRAGRISLRADAFYRVSFDYRVLASPEPAGRLNFSVESRAGQGRRAARVGRRSWREGAGVSGRKEIEFRTGPREDYELVFSAVNGSDWLIDNIEIAEVVAGWSPRGWNQPGYDDTQWSTCPVPQRYLHSQTTLLRIPFTVRDGRRVALFSAGIRGPITVWINGRKALERRNEHPFELEITSYVTLGDNLLAMEVAPEYRGQGPQGRMTMRETSPVFLSDLFISTTTLSEKSARLRWRATVHNPTDRAFEGTVTLSVTPWLPVESTKIAGEGRLSASLPARSTRELEGFLTLPSPQVWTPDSPALYLARAVLSDGKTEIDDVVDTFGVRTIEQRDGTLLLNGRPIVLRGAGDFSVFPPLSLADPTAAVPPRELLLRNVLLLKRMNANLFRWFPGLGMSAIDYESMGHPSNDETLPMLCDQLGMMLQWGAGFWVWQHDHEDDWRAWFSAAIPPAVRLHRNRPSVAIWEAGNENWHGMGRQEGTPVWSAWWDFCYELIKDHDDTRLILPSSYGIANRDIERAVSGEAVAMPKHWRAEDVVWDVHFYPGWYENWDYLAPRVLRGPEGRHWLDAVGDDNPEHRPFFFGEYGAEAMPVWDLYTREDWNLRWLHWDNQPMGRFEAKHIGRPLQFSEWELSQGYQALALQYVTTMGRIYNVDGFNVCALADTQRIDGTYHKGVCDVYRIPKYGYYSLAMVFQDLYVTAAHGDLALGRSDRLYPVIYNWGERTTVKGRIIVESGAGERLLEQPFGPVSVPPRGSVEACGPLEISFPRPGVCVMRAEVERLAAGR